jgi:RNA polymerase sigma-70 factor (ECF subfamily)
MRLLLALGRSASGAEGGLPRRRRGILANDGIDDHPALSKEDEALVGRIHAGEAAAFTELIDRYANGALRVAYRILHSRDTARDVLQNVLSDWWVRRAELAPYPSLRAYLFTAVRYQSLSELRRQRTRTGRGLHASSGAPLPDTLVDPDTIAIQSAERELDGRMTVETLLARLPKRRRLALQLRYLEQLSYGEIAQVMGISPKAAEHLVLRSLEALRHLA